jgi:hypothetical protein
MAQVEGLGTLQMLRFKLSIGPKAISLATLTQSLKETRMNFIQLGKIFQKGEFSYEYHIPRVPGPHCC